MDYEVQREVILCPQCSGSLEQESICIRYNGYGDRLEWWNCHACHIRFDRRVYVTPPKRYTQNSLPSAVETAKEWKAY